MSSLTPIPQPPTIPFLGNVLQIDKEVPVKSFALLCQTYGEIFKLQFPRRSVIFVSSAALVDELCDEKRFRKAINAALQQVRNLVGDGLFTAYHHEPNWGIAHRILLPAFSPGAIRDMFPAMSDICSQLIAKWDRFGPNHVIDPTEDFTRLAFDTISLATMSYRMNSFYSMEMQPFVESMGSFLVECGNRANRLGVVQNYLVPSANAKYELDQKIMTDITKEVIASRKNSSEHINDLLGLMLDAKDPQTGQGLSDQSIFYNLVTFLIAGHETTSGLLSFTTYHLLKNPRTYAKLREEVDNVIGKEPFRLEHMSKLPYMTAVFRETLRLTPSVTGFSVEAIDDTVIGGKYKINAADPVLAFVYGMHRDTSIWGEDVEVFRPERMLDGGFEKLPKNAWKPFGNGVRGCIGRSFAWQEIHIVVASLLQRFDLVMVDTSYNLQLKSTLTIKPRGFHIRAIPRAGTPLSMFTAPSAHSSKPATQKTVEQRDGLPMYLAYGTNAGTCKDFAQKLAKDAPEHGFKANVVNLDSLEGHIPTDGPVIVITASYEGEPPDNAKRFVEYLQLVAPDGKAFPNVRYAVFGCGHHDWVSTYQRIPKLVDTLLDTAGAERLFARGEGDAGADTLFDSFDVWCPGLWTALKKAYGDKIHTKPFEVSLSVEITGTTRAKVLQQDAALGTVVENRILTKPGVPVKHHIEIALPSEMSYKAGDYLSILPINPPQTVRRALARFGLLPEQQVVIRTTASTTLPTGVPISVQDVLSGYVELSQPATRKNIQELISLCTESNAAKYERIDYKSEIYDKRLSVLDILELHPEIDIPLATFLLLLPAMRIRQYSISSSPLWNPEHVTLTVSILDAPAISGKEEKFLGVASNYIAQLRPGDKVQVNIRPSAPDFHLPADSSVPVIMAAAGSGLAPMRAFIQERATQAKTGREVGKMLLFYGCRSPEDDYLYSGDDLKEWVDLGVVDVRPAFSRSSDKSGGAKYVQDRLALDKKDISSLFDANAKVYVCGSPAVAKGIKAFVLQLIAERYPEWDAAQVQAAFERIERKRYSTDVFA